MDSIFSLLESIPQVLCYCIYEPIYLVAEHSTFGFNKKGQDCNRNTKRRQEYGSGHKGSGKIH